MEWTVNFLLISDADNVTLLLASDDVRMIRYYLQNT